jgi:hypothetical protein
MPHSVVAMVSMAFGILGLAACLCCKDVDSKMTNKVSNDYDLSLKLSFLNCKVVLTGSYQDRGIPRKHRSLRPEQTSLD